MKPAIVLGTHVAGLAVIRALGTNGVPVIAVHFDDNDMGYVSKYVQEAIRAPHPEASEDEFVQLLIDNADRWDNGMLFHATDAALAVVARHKDRLGQHFIVTNPGWDIVKQFIDKKYTYALAERLGVPAPKTAVPLSVEDVERYGSAVEYPVLVKPSQAHLYAAQFKRKALIINNIDQGVAAYRQATDAGLEIMLQEFIPGPDSNNTSYWSYSWDGEFIIEATAEKLRTHPPQFGVGLVQVTKHLPEVMEQGRKILTGMAYDGYACTEFKMDARDGVHKLMDVNGRFNGSLQQAVDGGVNFPWIHYRHMVMGETPASASCREGLYWIDLTRDLVDFVQYRKQTGYSLRQLLQPYLRPHVFGILSLRDPKPFGRRLLNLIKRAGS